MDVASVLASAGAACAAGRRDECVDLCAQVLALHPTNYQANLLSGIVEVKVGNAAAAIPLLEAADMANPGTYPAMFWLSVALRRLGFGAAAIDTAARALAAQPGDPQALVQIGVCCLDSRLLPEAEQYLRPATLAAPKVLDVHGFLSHCVYLQGRTREALALLRGAVSAVNPPEAQLLRVGNLLLAQEYAAGAVELARCAVEIAPYSAQAHLLLGRSLSESDAEAAVQHLQRASELEPANADTVSVLGTALQLVGRLDEAQSAFRKSVELQPHQGYAYFALIHNRRATEGDRPTLATMAALADDSALAPRQRSYLHYGLGKAHDNLSEFQTAMHHYDAANRIEYELKLQSQPFDATEAQAKVDRTISTFSAELLGRRSGEGCKSVLPVLVVGMMRSGTTLVEQILSSHSAIAAGGEQMFWPDNWREVMDASGSDVDRAALRRVGERYATALSELGDGKERVVDKLPGNAFGLGVIHLAVPNARIVHVRRNPLDTCLSIYFTPNRARVDYAHDLGNIAANYRQYLRVMEHWRAVLPSSCMLEIEYEELVADPERVSRALIEFCGVNWEDACLRPQDNTRAVVTPSVWQVRQPIYRTSTNKWRNYEPWLGPLKELTGVKA